MHVGVGQLAADEGEDSVGAVDDHGDLVEHAAEHLARVDDVLCRVALVQQCLRTHGSVVALDAGTGQGWSGWVAHCTQPKLVSHKPCRHQRAAR